MTRGMYAAAGGMVCGLRTADVNANNLANVNTSGYRADRVSFGSFVQSLLPGVADPSGQAASVYDSATVNAPVLDLQSGALVNTGNELDMAVEGDGWFVVGTPAGDRYTRDGHFSLASDGTLVNANGQPVLGANGPIRVQPGAQVTVRDNGEVLSGATSVGWLRLVRLSNPASAVKEGGNLVAGGAPVADAASRVRQGAIESSNADPMRAMVEMVQTLRYVEMNQRIIQAQDSTLQQAMDVARR